MDPIVMSADQFGEGIAVPGNCSDQKISIRVTTEIRHQSTRRACCKTAASC